MIQWNGEKRREDRKVIVWVDEAASICGTLLVFGNDHVRIFMLTDLQYSMLLAAMTFKSASALLVCGSSHHTRMRVSYA